MKSDMLVTPGIPVNPTRQISRGQFNIFGSSKLPSYCRPRLEGRRDPGAGDHVHTILYNKHSLLLAKVLASSITHEMAELPARGVTAGGVAWDVR